MSNELISMIVEQFPLALWETLYATLLATLFSIILGLPLGILLVAGQKKGVMPLPTWLLRLIDVIINILRSIPFLIVVRINSAPGNLAEGSEKTIIR